jgi:hypothetical protein
LLVGCAGPTPVESRFAEDARAEAGQLVGAFAMAVRQDAPALVRPLLAPAVRGREAAHVLDQIARASWLELYTGLELHAERAMAGTSWRDWHDPPVEVEVPGTNAYGEQLALRFVLVPAEGAWHIANVMMHLPEEGEPMDLPPAVEESVLSQVRQVIAALRAGAVGTIHYELLPEGVASRYRPTKRKWYQRRPFANVPSAVPIVRDLERIRQFYIGTWPTPEEEVRFEFAPPNAVKAVYEVQYAWPAGGVHSDVLRLEMIFFPREGGMSLFTIRPSAEGIPYS